MGEGTKEGRVGKKRKQRTFKGQELKNTKVSRKKKSRKGDNARKSGPRLPSTLRKELDKKDADTRSSDDEFISEEKVDVYEYEEDVPEEEKGSNRRFDPVEDVEYELPDDFEVEFKLIVRT